MIEVKNIVKRYGKNTVLENVSFTVPSGKIYGLIGLNGAGKSTLMKIMCSMTFADSGEIFLDGEKRRTQPPKGFHKEEPQAVKLGYMIENPCFYGDLTGYKNLSLLAALYPEVDSKRIQKVLRIAGLEKDADKKFSQYSLGMKQRLHFASALLGDPSVLILDEPFNGIDPLSLRYFEKEIKEFAAKGGTVLISAHIIAELEKICDSAIFIHEGRIIKTVEKTEGYDRFEKEFFDSLIQEGQIDEE